MSDQMSSVLSADGPLAVICGRGSLPFAVADTAKRLGRRVVLFAIRGAADPQRVAQYPHHWARIGQFGRFCRLARAEGCRDVVLIGGLVRPTFMQLWPDLGTFKFLPLMYRHFRGGDGRLLSGVAQMFEKSGFRLVGADQVAPEILMPKGLLGGREPTEQDRADIARGLALLEATSPYDVGQAVVVADNRVLAVEAAEGTDEMLASLARLRASGRIRSRDRAGVLVKAPKAGQDRRVDLPSIGPPTVEGAARAGLAGIAVVAGSVIVAEAEQLSRAADKAKVFVIGIAADGH